LTWNGDGEIPLILLSRVAEDLRQTLSYVSGSDRSGTYGAADEEVLVEIDNAKLSALGLSFQEVMQVLSGLDAKKPIGQISQNGKEFLVKSKDNLTNISQVANLPIKVFNEFEIIRLGDIATLSKKPRDPPEELSLFNGERSVLVNISGAFSQRVDLYVEDIEKVVDEFRDQLPQKFLLRKCMTNLIISKKSLILIYQVFYLRS
jgi:multidrug efflux pump